MSGNSSPSDVTLLLAAVAGGDVASRERLFVVVHGELLRIAEAHMRQQRGGHTLDAGALVSEAYIKLSGGEGRDWESRSHFFRVAAAAMRSVLIDHARRKSADKRAGTSVPIELAAGEIAVGAPTVAFLDLEFALQELEAINPEAARVAELKLLGGQSIEDVAYSLGRSFDSVRDAWRMARNWLRWRLQDQDRDANAAPSDSPRFQAPRDGGAASSDGPQ